MTALGENESDEEIAARVRDMQAGRPDLDWDNLLMGRLAGPATDDRPDFPVWDYLDVVEADPQVSLRTLAAARFPVRYQEGIWSVTSIDEELKPVPTSYKGTLPAPRFALDEAAIVRRYRALHDAGVIAWDAPSRGLVFLVPAPSTGRRCERGPTKKYAAAVQTATEPVTRIRCLSASYGTRDMALALGLLEPRARL